MSSVELLDSILLYKNQLAQVDEAIKVTTDLSELQSLRGLKTNLSELIALTQQTINENAHDCTKESTSSDSISQKPSFDDEMSLFMSEIKSLEENASSVSHQCDNHGNKTTNIDEKLQTIKDELQNMVGKKCSAPHNHRWGSSLSKLWGSTSYHNAIICGVDESRDYDLSVTDAIQNFRLRILFTNPTHREMIPCAYFLDGECKFDAEKCHYSHGELVALSDLKEYQEPDFTKLTSKKNCCVLAKLNDRLWHKARVINTNFDEKTCLVRLESQKKREINLNFEDLFPTFHDDDDLSSSISSNEESSSSDTENGSECDLNEMRKARLIEQSLLNPATNHALGDWEKHTKGIGSKLMQKMGYIVGTGLGANGEGIIMPVSAQILPAGRSLDHCMKLREIANGDKNLFNAEKKFLKDQKKQDALNRRNYEKRKNEKDVFSFLNDSILSSNGGGVGCSTSKTTTCKFANEASSSLDLKSQSTKHLNVKSVKIADDIRKKEKEIIKIKESIKRHPSKSADIHKRLQTQLVVRNQELQDLKKSENSLSKEQMLRKNKDKLFLF